MEMVLDGEVTRSSRPLLLLLLLDHLVVITWQPRDSCDWNSYLLIFSQVCFPVIHTVSINLLGGKVHFDIMLL